MGNSKKPGALSGVYSKLGVKRRKALPEAGLLRDTVRLIAEDKEIDGRVPAHLEAKEFAHLFTVESTHPKRTDPGGPTPASPYTT